MSLPYQKPLLEFLGNCGLYPLIMFEVNPLIAICYYAMAIYSQHKHNKGRNENERINKKVVLISRSITIAIYSQHKYNRNMVTGSLCSTLVKKKRKKKLFYHIKFIPMNKNKKKGYKEELEERLVSLIASLFGGILRGSRRERLLSKFVENECEKIDRLMELYVRYSNRVKSETERMNQLELDDLEMDEEEKYNRRLESGLYTLQLIAVILGHLWTSEHPKMKARIELLLKQNKLTKKDVKDILKEYHDNIGDLDGPEEKERAQAKIQKFVSAF
ncbi:hypothetical protein U1Q18_039862 [Sarracenia purpurea var. burkii]